MSVTRSEVLTFRAPSFPVSYTNTISPLALQLPSELDWLLFLLLFPMLTTEPFGEVFWGRGLLGRDELWSFSRSSVETRWKEKGKKKQTTRKLNCRFVWTLYNLCLSQHEMWQLAKLSTNAFNKSILAKETFNNNYPFIRSSSLYHLDKATSPPRSIYNKKLALQ